jgi:hypothetical protein
MNFAPTQVGPHILPTGAARSGFACEAEPAGAPARCLFRIACMLFLVFACAEQAQAIPLSDYHERVRRAVTSIGSIGTALEGEARNLERERSRDAATLNEVRRLLPQSETVEWQGIILRVDNAWLAEALDNYVLLPVGDNRRAESMARIAERLQAIDERLAEMEREAAAGKTIDKEEEKARLAAILRRDEYTRQGAEENALTRLLKRIREWFRNLFPKKERQDEPREDSRAVNATAQIIVALLSLAVIVYVAWRFLPRFLRREMKKRKPKRSGARVVLGEHLDADESSADLLAEAESLARSGDLRAAIRKGYIALLCELHDRKLLRLEQHRTNRDYLRAVQSNPSLYEEMKPMTSSFENHWYGFIPPTETDWQAFRARYRKALTSGK